MERGELDVGPHRLSVAATEAGKPLPQVVCVLLNYNGAADTIECIRSLQMQTYPSLHITVVDNQSTDESVSQLRLAFPGLDVIESGANHGFAFGCNAGIRPALAGGADFVWLLNNDTIAPPDTLQQMVATAQSDAHIGITGTVLRYLHAPEQVQAFGGGSVSAYTGFSRHQQTAGAPGAASFITFASALIRREVFAEIGLLDDGYFMYFEDVDFNFRARAAGWKLAVAEHTAVLHKEGGSTGTSTANQRRSERQDRIVTASGMRFLALHGRPRGWAPWVYAASRLAKRTLRADWVLVRAVLAGVRDWRAGTPRAFQAESGW